MTHIKIYSILFCLEFSGLGKMIIKNKEQVYFSPNGARPEWTSFSPPISSTSWTSSMATLKSWTAYPTTTKTSICDVQYAACSSTTKSPISIKERKKCYRKWKMCGLATIVNSKSSTQPLTSQHDLTIAVTKSTIKSIIDASSNSSSSIQTTILIPHRFDTTTQAMKAVTNETTSNQFDVDLYFGFGYSSVNTAILLDEGKEEFNSSVCAPKNPYIFVIIFVTLI